MYEDHALRTPEDVKRFLQFCTMPILWQGVSA